MVTQRTQRPRRQSTKLALAAIALCSLACLSEQSFRMSPHHRRAVEAKVPTSPEPPSTRQWLQHAHAQLADLLPRQDRPPLLTEDLTDENGSPIDVFAHFGLRLRNLRTLLGNLRGLSCTAQGASQSKYFLEQSPPPWPGFEDVWIPIGSQDEDFSLSARIGLATDEAGGPMEAVCVVILPGLFGDNGVSRTRDLAVFLRESGLHVCSLETRGHGRTEGEHPDACTTFGVIETDELMFVSDWLETLPHVRSTGLVGYCWGANLALLAAWYDGRPADDPSIPESIGRTLHYHSPTRGRYQAGVIAFSPIIRWERLCDELETPRGKLSNPVYAAIQTTVAERVERKGYPDPPHSLYALIEREFIRCNVEVEGGVRAGYPFLRFLPHGDDPAYEKLGLARIPTLIVHAADDPLSPAQAVADLIATTDNPHVAALILPSGGHVGFAAYAKEYYFNLIANYFDANAGPNTLAGHALNLR